MVLWPLVVVLLLRGLASVAAPREASPSAPVPKAAAPAWPDDAARAFAADFARAYLSYSPSDPAASITALQAFVAPGLADSMAPRFGAKAARQTVGSVTVARIASLDSSHALVTVAVTVNAATRYLTVPVAHDGRGGLVVSDPPSFAAPPARAGLEDPVTEAVPAGEESAIQDVVSRFLRGYLDGDAGGIAYLVPRGARVSALAQKLQLVSVDSLALAVPAAGRERVVVASVSARDPASAATYELRYRLRLVRDDRWLVAAVNDATLKGG